MRKIVVELAVKRVEHFGFMCGWSYKGRGFERKDWLTKHFPANLTKARLNWREMHEWA